MSEARRADLAVMLREGPVAVAVITAVAGSTPREVGAWMALSPTRILGTIGGGEAEHRAVGAARRLLKEGGGREDLELPLGPALDQCCGGHLSVSVVRLSAPLSPPYALWPGGPVLRDPTGVPVVVYGAGHVGAAVVNALAPLPFEVTWIDGRAESVWPQVSPFPLKRLALPETAAMEAPGDACHLVMTHSHALDLEIVATVLERPFRFLGLIGSATKKATFMSRLRARGLDASRLTCPIGLENVKGKEPAVIAAATAAQLLALTGGGET
ncbi:MAG: xanthine dehydrogenase accessory protein XdhC [Pseudomonadota bacterium]